MSYDNYQSALNIVNLNDKYKFLYYGYKNDLVHNYITFYSDNKYLYFNVNNISGALISSKKILREIGGIFKVCCKTSFYCIILQEIGTITKLYDLNNAVICSFNSTLPSLTINDQLNNDYSFTLFIKNYLTEVNLLINLNYDSTIKNIKQNNIDIQYNITSYFNIDKTPLTIGTFKDLVIEPEIVNLLNYITVSKTINTISYNIDMIVNNNKIDIGIKNDTYNTVKPISSLTYNGLMYYITSKKFPMIIFINFVNNKSYIYNMRFELIDVINEFIYAATININNNDLYLNSSINNYKLNLITFHLVIHDLKLDDIENVNLNDVANNDVLTYNPLTNKWVNRQIGSASISLIDCGNF